jgi:tRNA threonylcarbamoyladenosine biosynthesis protein TsaE
MTRNWEGVSLNDLDRVAKELIDFASNKRVFALHGEMGAGKTTFVKSLGAALGVQDIIQSPTFSIVNEYQTSNNEKVYHFDFYRLEKLEEAYDIGYEHYLSSGNYCFIEWPEKVESLLNFEKADIFIEPVFTNRKITCTYE